MDVASASSARLADSEPIWFGGRERRRGERRAERIRVIAAATIEPAPPGPALAFMAHVLGQDMSEEPRILLAIYAAARRPIFARGVCADERA